MSEQTTEYFDAQEWPRDFDIRAEVAEQAELIESDDLSE